MMCKKFFKHTKKNSGYIIFFSLILTAIILSLTLAIVNVSVRQRLFTTQTKQSTRAFFAADVALDCLSVLDEKGRFGNTILDLDPLNGPYVAYANCAGQSSLDTDSSAESFTGVGGSTVFPFEHIFTEPSSPDNRLLNTGHGTCARAQVIKYEFVATGPLVGQNTYKHTINTWGYNIPCNDLYDHFDALLNVGASPFSSILVERSLSYSYEVVE